MKRLVEILVLAAMVALATVPASAQQRGRQDGRGGNPSHRPAGRDNSFSYRAVRPPVARRDNSFSYRVVSRPVVVVDHSFDYGYGYGRSYGYGDSYHHNRSGIGYSDATNGISMSSTGLVETLVMGPKVNRALDIAEARAEADRRRADSYAAEAEFQQLNALARDIKSRQEAKQLNAVDELAQENERLWQELELKQEGAKLKAENQRLKDELKKLE